MPLNKIKQTSKTLIFEEFNTSESVPDLYTLLRNEDVRQRLDFAAKVRGKLEVRSYEEFVKKFMPSVWEWCEQSNDPCCPVRFCYSLENPGKQKQAHEMELSENEFYKMVMNLYETKGKSGGDALEFDYFRVEEMLSLEKVMENAMQLRKDLQYNFDALEKLGSGAKTERNKYIRRIKEIRRAIVRQYKDSFTGKIKLALADTETQLKALPDQGDNRDYVQKEMVQELPCRVRFNDEGDLDVEVLQIEDHCNGLPDGQEEHQDDLKRLIGQDFDQYGGENSEYIKNLVISNYCGESGRRRLNREELIRKRNEYTMIFQQSQEQFIRAVSSAIEKMLNMKVFFEQACVKGRKLPAPVIIANCRADKLTGEESVKESFRYFIQENSREIGDAKIWFAVISSIGDPDFIDNPDIEEDLWEELDFHEDRRTDSMKTADGDKLIRMNAVHVILEILKAGQITAFFNFRANAITGFGTLCNDTINQYREKLKEISNECGRYAVFTYPNFTILPKKETRIEIGRYGEDGQEKEVYLDIPGIYVDAAYVAAGLVAASQDPVYLEKKKFKVNLNNPCVRFNLEDEENRFVMLTNMSRESGSRWNSEVEDNIGKDMFGFCFCGNEIFYKDNRVKNTYVYTARNMHKGEDGRYEPIYVQLTMDFIMQFLRTSILTNAGQNKYNRIMIQRFLEDDVAKWKREAEALEKKSNTILKENETIYLEQASNKLIVKFEKSEEEMELEIENK